MKVFTIPEIAKLLGVSRQAIYKKVVNGQIPAEKIGGIFFISNREAQCLLGKELSEEDKAFNQMVIPYVEAGYPCDIPLSLIDMVIKVEVDNTPSTLELAISARKETQS